MCFVCWGLAGIGLTAAAIDKKCNHSRITNKVKNKFNHLKCNHSRITNKVNHLKRKWKGKK